MDLLTDLAALICFLHLIVFSVSYPYYITFFFFFIGVFRGYHNTKEKARTILIGAIFCLLFYCNDFASEF